MDNLPDRATTLNASQRQRLFVTCKHVDRLLGDLEETLNASATGSVFPEYVNDLTPVEQKTIEDHIARIRRQLLDVLVTQSLAPETPHISASHSLHVNLTFIEIAITELSPHYMRGYGPVSEQGGADLNQIIAELQSSIGELHRYVLQPHGSE
jgi:hypothetical protein